MDKICSLCGKSLKELIEEELKGRLMPINSIHISIDDEYGYSLCDGCKEFLSAIIPQVLERLNLIKLDEVSGNYELVH